MGSRSSRGSIRCRGSGESVNFNENGDSGESDGVGESVDSVESGDSGNC